MLHSRSDSLLILKRPHSINNYTREKLLVLVKLGSEELEVMERMGRPGK
jgi:hypothetical protein